VIPAPAPVVSPDHEVAVATIRAVAAFIWPAAVVVLAIAFRAPIRRLIDRIHEIGVGGTRVLAESRPAQTTGEAVRPTSVPNVIGVGLHDPAVAVVEGQLRTFLNLDAIEESQKVPTLLSTGAQVSVAWMLERTNFYIYGSQIAALGFLNGTPQARRDVLRNLFYNPAVANFPGTYANYSFDQWLEFIRASGFVAPIGDDVAITDVGRLFYQYLIQQRLPLVRPN